MVQVAKDGIDHINKSVEKHHSLKVSSMFGLVAKQFPSHILYFMFLYGVEVSCKLGFSILLQILFELVSADLTEETRRDAYLIALACGILILVGRIGRHNAFYEIPILGGKIRSELIFIIYTKLSRISQYTAKSQ